MKILKNKLALSVAVCCGMMASASAMAASCTVDGDIWSNGYHLGVKVDSEKADLQGWTVALTFNQPPVILHSWGANLKLSGNTVTATNMPWNGFVPAGEASGFNLHGTHDGKLTKPTCEVITATSDEETASQLATSAKTSGELLPQKGNPVTKRYENQRKAWSQSKADIVLSYQFDNGGWPKNQSYKKKGKGGSGKGKATIDNGATTTEMVYLAQVYKDTKTTKYRDSVRKAMDYLFASQYSSGGWPQFYPLRGGYHDHVTFNDNAMTSVLTVLYHASRKDAPFDTDIFTDKDRQKMKTVIEKGVDYILKSQWKQNGKLTVWCAQHGKTDYLPKKARAYELASLSGSESSEIIGFLMTQPQTPKVKKAVLAALNWFNSPETYLADHTYDKHSTEKIVYKKGSKMWYRFYDLNSNRGFFSDRDGKVYYDIMDISAERRNGYGWGGSYGNSIIKYGKSVGYIK